MNQGIPKQSLQRLPQYLHYLRAMQPTCETVSAVTIAAAMGLHPVLVRKDLELLDCIGRPRIGYNTSELIFSLEKFLGYHDTRNAIVIGAGKLGRALMAYEGFEQYGLYIVAGFDIDPQLIGTHQTGKPIYALDQIKTVCERMHVHIGILTVPSAKAQEACDLLIEHGILAVWNFSQTPLNVQENILVHNENMAASLSALAKHLSATEQYTIEGNDHSFD